MLRASVLGSTNRLGGEHPSRELQRRMARAASRGRVRPGVGTRGFLRSVALRSKRPGVGPDFGQVLKRGYEVERFEAMSPARR